MKQKMKKVLSITALTAALSVSSFAIAGNNDHYNTDDKLKDAWIDGKIESALMINRHLNNFTIDTDVKKGVAYLSGTVESEVDKDLATELTKGIEGVKSVENSLKISEDYERKENSYDKNDGRTFGMRYDDATTTAAVKSKFLWNGEVDGLDINVDTMNGVVTLRGEADSQASRALAGKIAMNTDGVRDVRNKLKINQD